MRDWVKRLFRKRNPYGKYAPLVAASQVAHAAHVDTLRAIAKKHGIEVDW